MNEAILLILADAFECSAREAKTAADTVEAHENNAQDIAYHHGECDAYRDVAKRLRKIVEGGTGVHAPADV